jgi:chemotaxis protein histidine kinase CheA
VNSRIDPYVAYRLQLLQDAEGLRSLWELLRAGEPAARDRLSRFLHRLHGTSGTYGFARVSDLAHDLRELVLSRAARELDAGAADALGAALLEASLGQEAGEAIAP